jgi:hypothetical protein
MKNSSKFAFYAEFTVCAPANEYRSLSWRFDSNVTAYAAIINKLNTLAANKFNF